MNSSTQGYSRLLAIDPSLSCSGWALFDVHSKELLAVGKIRAPSARSGMLSARLEILQQRVTSLFQELGLSSESVMVCESPTTMKDPKAVIVLEQVRAIFEVIARHRKITVPGRVHPRTVQREVMGLVGSQVARDTVKDMALSIVQKLYSSALQECGLETQRDALAKHQDIVDATLIGHLALGRLSQWSTTRQLPLENFFHETRRGARLG